MRWIDAARARLRLLFARGSAESRMRDEFRFHIEMEMERLIRNEGLAPAEARRRALVAVGGTERYGEELREGRGFAWLSGLPLDLRLGLRMLVKHPGLAIIGALGMAVAIAIAAVSFGMIYAMMDPSLPLNEGDRVVMLQNLDTRLNNPNRATHLHDLGTWREQLTSVEDLGAFRTVGRNLLEGDGEAELVRVAEISASGFTLARVPPLLGRPLLESDERQGAPDVVVIGEEVWRNRFAAEADIIGRTIRLGTTSHTVVGVMPSAFRFPLNHQYWLPLRLNAADYAPGAGPSLDVFGRLADGASMAHARAEVETIARRLATSQPEVYATIRPQVLPYTYTFVDIDEPAIAWAYHLLQVLITLLLVVVGLNVAILMYARTVTRLGEITVRTALGASRRRIVLQLFAEALVLSSAAAVVGLAVAGVVLQRLNELLRREVGGELPFWFDAGLSPGLAAYVAALAVVAALIIGAAPALKATGRHIQAGLRSLGSGGSGIQLGRTWTLLIVTQVAIAMAVLPAAVHHAIVSARFGLAEPGYPAREFLQAWLAMERQETPPTSQADAYEREFTQRFARATSQLMDRLHAEPSVAHATFAQRLPGAELQIRVDIDTVTGGAGRTVAWNRVAPEFFAAFDMPLLAGRGFDAADASEASMAVVVDRTFVETVLGGGNVLGRTVRHSAAARERDTELTADSVFEIVGVVADFPLGDRPLGRLGTIYRPLAAGQAYPTVLVVRLRGEDASGYARRLHTVAMETDARLELHETIAMDEAGRSWQSMMRMASLGILLATLSVVLLAAAGIYAMMSFAVARRRREIGIRAALGAPPAQLLRAVFSRAAAQIALGVLVGLALAAALAVVIEEGAYAALLAPVAALMLTVGLLAAAGPARRGLSIQPTEALREE
ncbi:MAG: ABC transporter permease [Longimicrobiales bacterium]